MENKIKYQLAIIASFMVFVVALILVIFSNYTPFTNGIVIFASSIGNMLVLSWALDNMEKNM